MQQVSFRVTSLFLGLVFAAITGIASAIAGEGPALQSIKVPRDIGAGYIEAGMVKLDAPAGKDGVVVYIVNDHPTMVSHPARIYIKPGHDWGRFPIRASQQAKSRLVKIGASTGDDGAVGKMRLRPVPAQSRSLMQRNVPIRHRIPQ
ncbi:MAG: hypothetical protein ABF335_00100 [Alphaproteobacteria bacterium]